MQGPGLRDWHDLMRRAQLTLPPEALVWMMAPPPCWRRWPGGWSCAAVAAELLGLGQPGVGGGHQPRRGPGDLVLPGARAACSTSAMSVMAVLDWHAECPLIVGEWPQWHDLAAMVCVLAIAAVPLRRD